MEWVIVYMYIYHMLTYCRIFPKVVVVYKRMRIFLGIHMYVQIKVYDGIHCFNFPTYVQVISSFLEPTEQDCKEFLIVDVASH